MRVLLINPPHTAIGSRIPTEHLPPLGLLAVGGPLIDAGHKVGLIDADIKPMSEARTLAEVEAFAPEAIALGHSGSSSAHPSVARLTTALKARLPSAPIIYGGVFPTFHWQSILRKEAQIDIIVRGEGEQTIVALVDALEAGRPLESIDGIAFRSGGKVVATTEPPPIEDLDNYRVGWELVDLSQYSYWGHRRAVVIQLSRGCPHRCSYCGQRVFWKRWRHRDPKKLAAEMAWLHRTHGVEVFNFADENPTSSRKVWKEFLEALIAEGVSLTLVGSARADDIVRDADILHLYKKAGFVRFLLGLESTDEKTLRAVKKGGTTTKDKEAIQLLRQHDIVSMATCVFGFRDQTDRDFFRAFRQLVAYDPDQIQTLYSTPHSWTPYFADAADREVIQEDLSLWDYKHQVLAMKHMSPLRVILWIKLIEAAVQLRPKVALRHLAHPDPEVRHAMRWYSSIGRKVWVHEIKAFLTGHALSPAGKKLNRFFEKAPPAANRMESFDRREKLTINVDAPVAQLDRATAF